MTEAMADARADRAATTGLWLFAASVVMGFASLYSGYVLLRTGSDTWETPWTSGVLALEPWLRTVWMLLAATMTRRVAGAAGTALWPGILAGALFALQSIGAAGQLVAAGLTPSRSVALACWFVLTAAMAGLAAAGAVAGLWIHVESVPADAQRRRRVQLARYWTLVAVLWVVTLVGVYLV